MTKNPSQEARELLAAELRIDGYEYEADTILNCGTISVEEAASLRAIDKALNQTSLASREVVERAVAALHPIWFASDYNHKQAQLAVRAALSTPMQGEGGK